MDATTSKWYARRASNPTRIPATLRLTISCATLLKRITCNNTHDNAFSPSFLLLVCKIHDFLVVEICFNILDEDCTSNLRDTVFFPRRYLNFS